MRYDTFLFDLDNTLLDTRAAEVEAVKNLVNFYGIDFNDYILNAYRTINDKWWRFYEDGSYTREQITVNRFDEFFNYLNKPQNSVEANQRYLMEFRKGKQVISGVENLLKSIKNESCKIYIVTNGIQAVQEYRLKGLEFMKYIDRVFVSETVGYQKPSAKFFEEIEKLLNVKFNDKTIIIGDSLTSDIAGGNNAGIDTAWYNRFNITNDNNIKCTYVFNDITKLLSIIK